MTIQYLYTIKYHFDNKMVLYLYCSYESRASGSHELLLIQDSTDFENQRTLKEIIKIVDALSAGSEQSCGQPDCL